MELFDALNMAARIHRAQLDKAGLPYLTHPVRVMMRLPADASDLERKAALLHDAIEDGGPLTPYVLMNADAEPELMDMLRDISKRPGEPYDDYLRRVAASPARRVKLADIADNNDPKRLALLPPALAANLKAKYDRALEFFKEHASQRTPGATRAL